MPQSRPVHYSDAVPEVQEVYDDIKTTRGVNDVNNFWKHIANHPPTLRRTWENVKEAMTSGALDSMFKEMVFVAVSASNGCEYCLRCHTDAARKQGMTDDMLGELLAVVNVASQSNILANGYQIPLDDDLKACQYVALASPHHGNPAKPAPIYWSFLFTPGGAKMAEVFVLGGGTPTPTEFRPGSPKTVNHQTPISRQSRSKVPG